MSSSSRIVTRVFQPLQKKSPTGLTYGDALVIRRLYKQAKLVVPVCRVFGDTRLDSKMIPAKVFGTTADYPDNLVIGELQRGYRLHDRVRFTRRRDAWERSRLYP